MKRLRPSWRQYPPRWLIVSIAAAVLILLGTWLFESRVIEPVDSYAACVAAGNPVTETYPPLCRAHGQTFTGPGTAPPAPQSSAVSLPFELLVDGDSLGTYPHRQEVITSADQWQRYWREVHAGLPSTPPILPVDFSHNTVIALSLGRQPTGGANVKVANIMTSTAGTVVDVQESTPGDQCLVTQALTNPYFIVRTGHLPEPVSFRISSQKRNC
jgi:hypothetical protein